MLNNRGLEYTEVDVTEDADALAFVKDLGYQAAPVVYTVQPDYEDIGGRGLIKHWTQFRPDHIAEIVK